MIDIVKRAIAQRRADKEQKKIPFIDSLLQNYDDEDKVNRYLPPSLFLSPSFSLTSSTNSVDSLALKGNYGTALATSVPMSESHLHHTHNVQ